MRINLIVACCQVKENFHGIGFEGKLPWNLKSEMKHFTKMTKSGNGPNSVLMGRKTWESIPEKFRPLPKRFNAVITRKNGYEIENSESAKVFSGIEEALNHLKNENFETCWVIGGSEIYNPFIENRLWDRIYLTKILTEFECDRFFPDFGSCKEIWDEENVSKEIQEENGVKFSYQIYEK